MNTNMSLEEIRSLVAAKKAERNSSMEQRIEEIQLRTMYKRLTDPATLEAEAALAVVTQTTDLLKALISKCVDITTQVKVFNLKTNENRKWAPRKILSYGNHMALVTELLYGLQYAAKEHKSLMLEVTGLSEDLVESTISSLGSPAYYSQQSQEIVEEISYNYNSLMQNLSVLEGVLGVSLNLVDLTEKKMETYFTQQLNRAYQQEKEVLKTTLVSSNLINI
jgi:hypothetical protein